MKKVSLLLLLLIAITSVRAQMPDNWTDDLDIDVFQESSIVHAGNYSAGIMVNSGTQANCDFENTVSIPVTSGDSYTISFWGYTSVAVRARAVFIWEGASTTYSNEYLDPNSGGWMEFISEGTVPDGATGVRPGIRFYDVAGFTPGEVQYIDDVTFESPSGTAHIVANGDLESWPGTNPEPTNYPTAFTATAGGLNAVLAWVDATGDQLPSAYLIKASTQNNIANPVDGVFVSDDPNLADGTAAVNVAYGEESYIFSNLEGLTTYYFKIFPYTNSGANTDYKNDGTPPSAQVDIASIVVIEAENLDASWGNWTPISVVGDQVWNRDNTFGVNSTPCAQMTGYNSGNYSANEDWLISPSMDFTAYQNETFSFYSAVGYITAEEQFAARISTDYNGGGDPTTATWTDLNPILPDGAVNWVWTNSGSIDISAYESDNVHVALIYTCGTTAAATWEVDNMLITGEGEVVIIEEPSNYPADFAATASGQTINLSWVDATGVVIPQGYLILGSDQDNISLPADGTPVANDTDFSDGMGAHNVGPGAQAASFAGLTAEMTYYFKIFPYTNSGSNIDFKTDGTVPSAEATTTGGTTPGLLFTDFNESWGGWTPLSLVGDQVWKRDNTFGLESTPCALMSGYSGGAVENEDWLISPAVSLTGTMNPVVSFYSSANYDGPALVFKISTDYNGTGNPNDFNWTDLSGMVNWSAGAFEWTASGDVNISAYTGNSIHLAFVYFSTTTGAANWELDNVMVEEAQDLGEPTNYPTNFALTVAQQTITASWTDATGAVIPEAYLIKISTLDDITLPVDGTPVADDADMSDGMGAMNVMAGTGQITFPGLMANTTYYAKIFPYTNSGVSINYKTDATPPSAEATTAEEAPDILFTTFNTGWENWTPVSVVGDLVWDINNTYGIDGTACAKMTGYSGGSFDNEDWLISPAIDLSGTIDETLSFYCALGYTGPALQLLISTSYDGSGNPGGFGWDNLTNQATWPATGTFFEFTHSGSISLADYTDQTIYVAFQFTSNTTESATYEIDNIRVQGISNGIGENTEHIQVNLYPNPGNGLLFFDTEKPVTSIEVFNITGMKVSQLNPSATSGTLDLTNLERGVYIVRFLQKDSERAINKRIVIQ